MKKTLFTLTLLALLLGVSSCSKEKEGKFNPKEKLKAVYQEYASYYGGELQSIDPKYMSEEWVWNDSQLDRILYYEQSVYEPYEDSDYVETEQELVYTQLFTYDRDDRVVKSEVLGMVNMTTTCEYEGKYLKSMTVMEDKETIASFLFNRDGDKISSFDLTLSDSYFDMDKQARRQFERILPLRFILSPGRLPILRRPSRQEGRERQYRAPSRPWVGRWQCDPDNLRLHGLLDTICLQLRRQE